MKPSEQSQVNFIADFLRKGESRNVILAKFGKKWQGTSTRTFDRRLRQAEADVAAEQARIKEQAEQEVAKEADALKSKILTSLERQAILSQIATGELAVEKLLVTKDGIKKAMCKPDHSDIKNAISELNKMDGSYSPTKADITTGGDKLTDNPAAIIKFDGQSIEILK